MTCFLCHVTFKEAFKAPVIQINSGRLNLQKALPDLLFADLPPEQLLRTTVSSPEQYLFSLEDHFSGGESLSDKETGLHTRSYYTSEQADICIGKPAGALKTVSWWIIVAHMLLASSSFYNTHTHTHTHTHAHTHTLPTVPLAELVVSYPW